MLFIATDMEHGSEPAVLPKLLQDEDVSCHRCHPHELRRGAERLQSLVSAFSSKSLTVIYHVYICLHHGHSPVPGINMFS